MEMKSVIECLNFIDDKILCIVEKSVGIGTLEDIRNYVIVMYNEKFIEELVAMSAIFSQINLKMENFYLDRESDNKKQIWFLRKRILAWLEESNTKPETDDQQLFKIYKKKVPLIHLIIMFQFTKI